MLEFFQRLFNSSDFMPHGHCYFWRPGVLWTHVISDGVIALSYFSIPLALVYLVRKRDDLPFRWLFWLFGIFIVACGTTHILAIVTVWDPIYRLDGVVKAITAIASAGTAAALVPIIPKALGLASPEKLMQANLLLENEITARRAAEAELAGINHEMEERVRQRTAELADSVARLRESEGRLHAVLAAAPVVLFATDAKGVFTFSEGRGLEPLGVKPGQWVGQSFTENYRGRAEILGPYERALAGEEVETETDLGGFVMDMRFAPTRGDGGAITGVTGISLDVTVAQRARESLREAKEEAERANNAKSEFLSRMSHELRTPLNAVLGFAQLLELGSSTPEDAASVQQILKAGRHLLALIDEVLDISRIETGRLDLTLEPLSVPEMVDEALKLLGPLALPRRIQLENAGCTPEVFVLADKLRFHQSLLNLLANAVKFNREGGAVRVSCERHGERVRVLVSDTGPGISEEDLPKLFTPFERLNANERNIDGSGIGLALSKRLIESQGGQIGVRSRVDEGSAFWIDLPAAEAPPVSAAVREHDVAGAQPAGAVAAKQITVLYIEDNVSNFTLVETLFKRYPQVQLIVAMQGVLGVEMARQHWPALILLDLQLPDIRGDEVLRRLRADPVTRGIPVVMLSADATPPQIERLLAAGAGAYLTKPLDLKKFLSVVGGYLNFVDLPR